MPLIAYLLAAMIAWVPLAEHASFEPVEVTEARYVSIASDIASVTADDEPVFEGHDARARTALLLASIASYESHFAARVDDCTVSGQGALSLWQIHAPRTEVCSSRQDAARRALTMVRESFAVCRRAPVLDRLALYTDGVAVVLDGRGHCREEPRSRWRVGRAVRWFAAHPLVEPGPA